MLSRLNSGASEAILTEIQAFVITKEDVRQHQDLERYLHMCRRIHANADGVGLAPHAYTRIVSDI